MKLDTRVEQALQDINFVERYEALSNKSSILSYLIIIFVDGMVETGKQVYQVN